MTDRSRHSRLLHLPFQSLILLLILHRLQTRFFVLFLFLWGLLISFLRHPIHPSQLLGFPHLPLGS